MGGMTCTRRRCSEVVLPGFPAYPPAVPGDRAGVTAPVINVIDGAAFLGQPLPGRQFLP